MKRWRVYFCRQQNKSFLKDYSSLGRYALLRRYWIIMNCESWWFGSPFGWVRPVFRWLGISTMSVTCFLKCRNLQFTIEHKTHTLTQIHIAVYVPILYGKKGKHFLYIYVLTYICKGIEHSAYIYRQIYTLIYIQ